jgi:Fe(3+) dicitrate transport protein
LSFAALIKYLRMHINIILLASLCSCIHASPILAQDTIKAKPLQQVNIEGKRHVHEVLPKHDGAIIYTAKKNDVVRLASLEANLSNNNTRQVFARVAGISIWELDGSGTQVSVATRGLSPNRSWEFNTRQNGYDIAADVFGYPEAYYNPPLEAVEKIEVIRGGASLQFGPQFGGVLNYVLKKENGIKPLSIISQNTFGSNKQLSTYNAIMGNINKWNYNIYHHQKSGNSWRHNSQYNVRNTHAALQYKFSNTTSLSAEYTNMYYVIQQPGGLTDTQFAHNSQQSLRQRNWLSIPWQLAALNFDVQPNKNCVINIKAFGLLGQRNSIGVLATPNIGDTINTTFNTYNTRQVDRDFYKNIGIEARARITYKILNKVSAIAVGSRAYYANTIRKQKGKGDSGFSYNTNIFGKNYGTELSFVTSNLAAFAENDIAVLPHLHFTTALRYEFIEATKNDLLTQLNIEQAQALVRQRQFVLAGAGLAYELAQSELYANCAQAYRPILFSDITPPNTLDVIDDKLKDANGLNAELGYRGTMCQVVQFDFNLFYLQYNNKIGNLRQYIDNDPTQATYIYRTNLGTAVHQGIEAYISWQVSQTLNCKKQYGSVNAFATVALVNARYQNFITSTASGTAPHVVINTSNLRGKKVEYAPAEMYTLGIIYSYKQLSTTMQIRNTSSVFTDANNTVLANSTGTIGQLKGYTICDASLVYKYAKYYNITVSINNIMQARYATRRSNGYPGPGIIPGEGRTFNIGFGVRL